MSESEGGAAETWWKAPRFILSAAIVALLAILGVILAIVLWLQDGSEATPTTEGPPSSSSPPAPSPSATESGASVCGLSATGGTTLTAPPEDLEWVYLGAIAAPESEKHGPALIDEETGLRSCYSHTPAGALLSFAGLLAASGDLQLWQTTVQSLVLPGPGKEKTLDSIEESLQEGRGSAPPIELEGFRLLSYAGDKATIEIVASADSGEGKAYVTSSANMVWHGGDWHFKVGRDGTGGPVSGQVSDLSEYVEWGPGNG